MEKDSLLKGGVMITHQNHDGKHQYEVQDVIKFKTADRGKAFARKGDRLMTINDINLQDVTPEDFAQILSQGNPMLTVHLASKMEKHVDQGCHEDDNLHPISKETTLLHFSMEMRREEDLGEADEGKEKEERREENEGMGGEIDGEDICQGEDGEKGPRDLLVVTMTKTSITVVKGRGCDAEGPCHECTGRGCNFKEVVMLSESSTMTLVSRGRGSGIFKQEKQMDNISIEHAVSQNYLRGFCLQNTPYVSPNPEKMTIYYYKSNCIERTFRGMPVVLNFTDSNCFLKCCRDGERVLLQVETCEKERLKQISRSDQLALSFLFYMKASRDRQRQFESALCPTWFIHVVNTDTLQMANQEVQGKDPSFFFVIRK
ncbi:uncharacterized protein LOC130111257 [Lampris incognitus]|uniref:uncharacterized protein LOC130111257 n=1 Tax=Lampris incognitus TaxID=2546036 RepID=UPI0024B588E7|nr:uncharacterized protein LOC130111257 [Lampris incognitus]